MHETMEQKKKEAVGQYWIVKEPPIPEENVQIIYAICMFKVL